MRAAVLVVVMLVACGWMLMFLMGIEQTRGLPHRHQYESFPQAVSPASNCPGQHAEYVYADDGTQFFLECFGSTIGDK